MKTIVVYGLKNVMGGIENYLMMMHEHLHNQLKFVFIVEEADCFIYEESIKQNEGVIEFLSERHNLAEYRKHLNEILSKYHDESNIFYVNVGHISFDIIPISMALNKGYRVITHSHNSMQEPIKRFDYRVRQGILRMIGMCRLKRMNVKRLAVSEESGEYLYKGKPFEIVTPGIETGKFLFNQEVRNNFRQKLGLNNCLVIGYVGRLVSVKNPLFLIDVLQEIKKRGIRSRLLVLGDGGLKEKLIEKAKEANVQQSLMLIGTVDNVQDYLQAMDVLLAPSLSEGLGLFIVEAQAAGLPCVCAEGNIPKLIDVTGNLKFEKLDAGAGKWCDELLALISEHKTRSDMNEKVAESDFNIDVASKRLFEVLNAE